MNELLLASVLFPLLLALVGLIPVLARASSRLAPWASAPALILVLTVKGDSLPLELPSVLFGSQIGLDGTGRVFLLLSALLWLASGLSSAKWDHDSYRLRRYWFFQLLTLTGNLGVSLSQDAGSFYAFFALMTFSGFGLISHDRSLLARSAGRVYLSLAIVGEMLILSGLILATHEAGSVEIQSIKTAMNASPLRDVFSALIFVGFGVKVGVVPLHVWLPLSYSAAPIPAAAVLSGAMTKAGVLGWLRFLPLGLMFSETWSLTILSSGALMAFYGALIGLAQSQPKTALAYSSLSQMGYLALAIGTALEPGTHALRSVAACLAYAIHHGTTKAALFLGLAVVATTERDSLLRKIILVVLLLLGLSLVGVPLTGGAYVKTILKGGGSPDGQWHGLSGIVMAAGSVATALLVARILVLFARTPQTQSKLRPRLVLPWGALVVISLLSPILIPALLSAFEPALSTHLSGGASSGVALTMGMTVLLLILSKPVWARASDQAWIPPGDLLIPVQRIMQDVSSRTASSSSLFWNRFMGWSQAYSTLVFMRGLRAFMEIEKLRTRGFAGSGLLLIVWAAFWLLLVWGDL